jgi:predicted CXXCH cytochrome family protein
MNIRLIVAGLILLTFMMMPNAAVANKQQILKLQPGAEGVLCLKCHTEFEATLKKSHLHPLVKARDCVGCHFPHASDNEGLLKASSGRLCLECHADVLPEGAHSVHDIVTTGNCQQCHDPHGSENRSNLLKPGNQLCFECHADIGQQSRNARFKHRPVSSDEGCLSCHQPHASQKQDYLLKNEPRALCLECHKTNAQSFKRKHLNYPVAESRCSDCHSPHGSDRKGILYEVAHAPMLENNCTACHNPADSPQAIAVKKEGVELCRQCHERWIDQKTAKERVHWPMFSEDGCTTCHNPHASREKQLLRGNTATVCGQCHADTVELQRLAVKNAKNNELCEPVLKGQCASCHAPHGADNVLLFEASDSLQVCGRCHEWQTHSSHPIGEKIIDPRNQNLTLDCLSCHRGCGTTTNPVMLQFPTTYDLCVSCHVDRRR